MCGQQPEMIDRKLPPRLWPLLSHIKLTCGGSQVRKKYFHIIAILKSYSTWCEMSTKYKITKVRNVCFYTSHLK